MTHIELIPTLTPDGRQIIFRAIELTPAERLRRLAARLGLPVRQRDRRER